MPGPKKTSKFAKELKKPDEFISATLGIANFIKQKRKTIMSIAVAIICVVSVILGIHNYRRYMSKSASLKLYNILQDYKKQEDNEKIVNYNKIIESLRTIQDKYPDSTPAVIAAIKEAELKEDKGEYIASAQLLEETASRWTQGGTLNNLLLLGAGIDYERAGEFDKALKIYDSLLQDKENLQNERIFLRKAETLKKSNRAGEAREFIMGNIFSIQDEKVKIRLQSLLEDLNTTH